MDEKIRKEALNVVDKLLEHPLANIFIDPIQPNEGDTEFEKIVTNPQDLTSIKNRLINNEYTSISKFYDDMESVWVSTEQYYSTDPHLMVIAADCRKTFNKLKRSIDVLSMGTWCTELFRLKNKAIEIMNQPPNKMKQYSSSSSSNSNHTQKQTLSLLSEREIQNFITASEMMNEEEQNEIVKIISEIDPEVDPSKPEINLNVTKMNLSAIYAVRDFMKNALEKRGQKYPE
ncbi:Bromodomain containing protein [Histomonas meleagridis]|uniref:Bromodomain containing protein n=1 Tax=Histomonas meleagridis TaxID=135588 RepID=UPI00355AC38C|nr:Bromodomain containing protein [Histomonas meleagridis]KAH0798101.1 Bromodomain containing protein [Histomonas meleagridis]